MSDEAKHTPVSKGMAALIAALVVLLGAQSIALFALWRDLPREHARANEPADHAICAPGRMPTGKQPPASPNAQARAKQTPFDELDDFWKELDKNGWDPMAEFRHLREQMDSLFDDSFGRFRLSPGFPQHDDRLFSFSPDLDLQEKDDAYIARMDIPGADKNALSVKIEDRVLTVSGQIDESSEEKDGDHVLRKERRMGHFERSVTLPGPVIADKLDAQYANGVLTVTLPKAKEASSSKSIQVK